MNLPKITARQQEILDLIYSYRFMTRQQIQAFMGHTDKRRISAWLLDLREKHYLEWIYDSKNFYAKTQPAIYYMGINGVRHYLEIAREDGIYPVEEVRKRYRESSRSKSYIEHCLLIADCCVTLAQADTRKLQYYSETEAEYIKGGDYASLKDIELIHPHLCFIKYIPETDDGEAEVILDTFFLEVFDANYPRFRMSKRLKDYIEYLHDTYWDDEMDKAPVILVVCPRLTDLIYSKRRTRGLFSNQYIQDSDTPEEERLHIRFTTAEKLKVHGILGDIWEEA